MPGFLPKPVTLHIWLSRCKKLVERVEWQTTKTSQGNIGNHESERNIKVFPFQPGIAPGKKRFLEFEVTRNDHMSENAA